MALFWTIVIIVAVVVAIWYFMGKKGGPQKPSGPSQMPPAQTPPSTPPSVPPEIPTM